MANVRISMGSGGTTSIDEPALDALRASVKGRVVTAGSGDYDEARTIWNAMIDRHPALVIRCQGADDVVQAVRFAARHKLLTSVRGGGHNIAGNAVCDGGLMIDLSLMSAVTVDAKARTARVEGGATLADFDGATQQFGLATPVGINSTTGVAGLTLGGGFGWLSRSLGLTIDNLISADVVTADGQRVTASATRIRISSGASAAVAATSAWSPRSSSRCTRSAPTCCRASSSIRSPRRTTCCASIATSSRRRPSSSSAGS